MSAAEAGEQPVDEASARRIFAHRPMVSLVLAVLVVVAAAFFLHNEQTRPVGRPVCEGKTMSPGDLCLQGSQTKSFESGMEDLRKSRESGIRFASVAIGFGLIRVLAVGAVAARPRRARFPAPAPGPVTWHAGYDRVSWWGILSPLVVGLLVALGMRFLDDLGQGESGFVFYAESLLRILVVLVVGGITLVCALPWPGLLIRADSAGLQWTRGTKVRGLGWDRIDGVHQVDKDWEVRHEGVTTSFGQPSGAAQLAAWFDRDSRGRRIPRLAEQIAAGGVVELGEVAVALGGIRVAGNMLGWGRIGTLGVADGQLVVRDGAGQRLATVPTEKISDLPTFLALVEEGVRAHRKQP